MFYVFEKKTRTVTGISIEIIKSKTQVRTECPALCNNYLGDMMWYNLSPYNKLNFLFSIVKVVYGIFKIQIDIWNP